MNAPLASFTNYDELRRALNAVRDYRQMSLAVMNDLAGCADGYFEKILGPRPGRHVGVKSLSDAFGVLGIKCVLIEDPEAWARIERHSRRQIRDAAHLASVRGGAVCVQLSRGFLRKIGRKGGANSRKNLSKRQRTKLAKIANIARNKKMTPEQRRRSAILAAKARWAKKKLAARAAGLPSTDMLRTGCT